MKLRPVIMGVAVVLLGGMPPPATAQNDFRVPPYLQHPADSAITIQWYSNDNQSGRLVVQREGAASDTFFSAPIRADELAYPAWEVDPDDPNHVFPDPPYRHSIRVGGLPLSSELDYEVLQGQSRFASTFRTGRGIRETIRFIVYGDSETEPESDGKFGAWPDPTGADPDRKYVVDQSRGYEANLSIMRMRDPDFVAIAGDLVQSGGEQRDWDRFWQHNTHPSVADSSLGGRSAIIPVPGNHEYFASPHAFSGDDPKSYRQPWSEQAMARYRNYFDVPANGSNTSQDRYYRLDYGPVTLIGLDVSNNGPNGNEEDTNFYLLGTVDTGGGQAPSFGPGSAQYEWLSIQLKDARQERPFVFVMFHYAPYSVGPHSLPAGLGDGLDPLSGVPVRTLTPLFMQYGVDAVFSGHDEIWERSVVSGMEQLDSGEERPHDIHFYDLGTGGDDLRAPVAGQNNPFQAFIAHSDVPETWNGDNLVSGGKHYGHLEVEVTEIERGTFRATLTPVYAFPVMNAGTVEVFERRTYPDEVVLTSTDSLRSTSAKPTLPGQVDLRVDPVYPNPARSTATLSFVLGERTRVRATVFDTTGREVRNLIDADLQQGTHTLLWDLKDGAGRIVASGTYLMRIETRIGNSTVPFVIAR